MSDIQITNLNKSYGDKPVLKNINLRIEKGKTLVILGKSGSGKSVLLRHLIGIEKPDSGSILIDEIEMTQADTDLFNTTLMKMGMLFQAGALFDSMNVFENVAFYLRMHPDLESQRNFEEHEITQAVHHALESVGLLGSEHKMPSELSGGMKKRAALARLIAYRPKILFYDEPTTGLDPLTAMQINNLILSTQKQLNATSVVVTHDLCSTMHVADQIAFIDDGKILHHTSKEEFIHLEDPKVQDFLKNAVVEGLQ